MLKHSWLALPFIVIVFLKIFKVKQRVIVFHKTYEQNVYSKYEVQVSFQRRREILRTACNYYDDPFTHEYHSVSTVSDLEPARRFLLNHGMTSCIPAFENSDKITDLIDQLIQDKSDSELSYLEPCARLNLQKLAENSMQSWIQEPVCNLAEKISAITNKIVAVQHPLERIATYFQRVQQTHTRNLTFPAFVNEIVTIRKPELPQHIAHLKPYWQACNLCSKAFRPTIVIKYEYFNADILGFFNVMNFTEYLENLPLEILEVKEQGPSIEAQKLFSQIHQSYILDLFEIFRADHDLFGYDPSLYIDLGIK